MQSDKLEEICHDFLSERKYLTVLSGFLRSSSWLYILYRLLLILTMVYMILMAVIACVLDPRKQKIIEAVHFMLLAMFITYWCLAHRISIHRSCEETCEFLKTGVYRYEEEENDPVILKMKKEMLQEIRRKSNICNCMFVFGGLTNTTLFPLSQLIILGKNQKSVITNPYFPHLFYQPYATDKLYGLVLSYVLGIAIYYTMYIISCAITWYYISGVVQLKVHFRVLNFSISKLQTRALDLYVKRFGSQPKSDLKNDAGFQRCLYMSFRANIQHHQALLRLRKLFEPFSGSLALSVFSLSSMVYGCQLYLLYQVNPINVCINIFLAFAAEQCTVIFICFLGEEVLRESDKIFHCLYKTDWFNYDRKFNQILQIMMSNTLKPTGVKALLFGVPACFETYGHVISAMYKVMNIVRQSDIM